MKNYKSSMLQAAFLIAASIGTLSFMNHTTEDTTKVVDEKTEQRFDNTKNNKKDARFLVDAAEIIREGITLGQLAQQKGESSHLTELGEMMEDEHTKSWAD